MNVHTLALQAIPATQKQVHLQQASTPWFVLPSFNVSSNQSLTATNGESVTKTTSATRKQKATKTRLGVFAKRYNDYKRKKSLKKVRKESPKMKPRKKEAGSRAITKEENVGSVTDFMEEVKVDQF